MSDRGNDVYDDARAAFNAYAGMDAPDLPETFPQALQVTLHRWAGQFKNTIPPFVVNALGVNEETGECGTALLSLVAHTALNTAVGRAAHIVLKASQGIRGYDDPEKCRREIADALADIAIYSMQLATCFRLDYWTIVKGVALKVLKRNWEDNPMSAHIDLG